jgi:uncharacterized protein (DUF58 family)
LLLGSFAVFGGAIRGFNLLLVLAALLLGGLLIQWRWARRSITVVSGRRRLPLDATAGDAFTVRFWVTNHSRFWTVWMLRLEDRIERGSAVGSPLGVAAMGIAMLPPQQVLETSYDCQIDSRGRYQIGPFHLETRFPFSLFCSRKTMADRQELVVFPRLLTLQRNWQRGLLGREGGMSFASRRAGTGGGEFFGLRPWQDGDNPRWIHWRTSARMLTPSVRQFEQQRRYDLCLVVDGYAPRVDTQQHPSLAETAISLAATIASHLAQGAYNRIILGIAGADVDVTIGGGSEHVRRQLMVRLAEAEFSPQPPLVETIRHSMQLSGGAGDLIVISPRGQVDAFAGAGGPVNLRSLIPPRCGVHWINVDSEDLDRWIMRGSP